MTEIGTIQMKQPMESAIRTIRDWLTKIQVDGITIDTRYDPAKNIALLRFSYTGKNYEFSSTKQTNCKQNMWAIARVIEYKVRSHLMKIEPFEKSMVAYVQIGASAEAMAKGFADQPSSQTSDEMAYATLGISPLASNDELVSHYKMMMKSFHPDLALSELAKKEFGRRSAEINQAWENIKRERGL
jgi:hypothetical protein